MKDTVREIEHILNCPRKDKKTWRREQEEAKTNEKL